MLPKILRVLAMNKQLNRLLEIATKPERKILGLMSGTSLDGLDIALCQCASDMVKVLRFKSIFYSEEIRVRIASVQSKITVNLEEVCILNSELAHLYANWICEALQEWKISADEVDAIASHGQTLYHHPAADFNSTLQIVDGDQIAQKTGIITIFDFRQKHTAAGGEGAPLVALMDEALFRHNELNRMLLNLGGIANFTWLPAIISEKEVVTSDTGPANTLINEAMHFYFDEAFDTDGNVALSGNVHKELLGKLLEEPFLKKPFPKTTGQEDFNLKKIQLVMEEQGLKITPKDIIATLTQFTIKTIADALKNVSKNEYFELYVSGGGLHNPVIMKGLKKELTRAIFKEFEDLGMPPDAKEAALMAFLANDLLSGEGFMIEGEKVHLGKICLPN